MAVPFSRCSSGAHLPGHARRCGDRRARRPGRRRRRAWGRCLRARWCREARSPRAAAWCQGKCRASEGGRLVGRRRRCRGRRLRRRGRSRVGARLIDGRRRLLLRRLRRRGRRAKESERASSASWSQSSGRRCSSGRTRDRSGAALSPSCRGEQSRSRTSARRCSPARAIVVERHRSVHYLHEIGVLHREPSCVRRSPTMSGPTPTRNESGENAKVWLSVAASNVPCRSVSAASGAIGFAPDEARRSTSISLPAHSTVSAPPRKTTVPSLSAWTVTTSCVPIVMRLCAWRVWSSPCTTASTTPLSTISVARSVGHLGPDPSGREDSDGREHEQQQQEQQQSPEPTSEAPVELVVPRRWWARCPVEGRIPVLAVHTRVRSAFRWSGARKTHGRHAELGRRGKPPQPGPAPRGRGRHRAAGRGTDETAPTELLVPNGDDTCCDDRGVATPAHGDHFARVDVARCHRPEECGSFVVPERRKRGRVVEQRARFGAPQCDRLGRRTDRSDERPARQQEKAGARGPPGQRRRCARERRRRAHELTRSSRGRARCPAGRPVAGPRARRPRPRRPPAAHVRLLRTSVPRRG